LTEIYVLGLQDQDETHVSARETVRASVHSSVILYGLWILTASLRRQNGGLVNAAFSQDGLASAFRFVELKSSAYSFNSLATSG
jgi:hypothetical protein